MSGKWLDITAEMFAQVAHDFLFNGRFQHDQQKAEMGLDLDALIVHYDLPVNARSFEVNHVTIPAIIDGKFFRQVLG